MRPPRLPVSVPGPGLGPSPALALALLALALSALASDLGPLGLGLPIRPPDRGPRRRDWVHRNRRMGMAVEAVGMAVVAAGLAMVVAMGKGVGP